MFENFSCILGRGKSARKWSKMLGCVAQISSCMSGLNYVLTINSVSVSGLKYQISLLATKELKKKETCGFLNAPESPCSRPKHAFPRHQPLSSPYPGFGRKGWEGCEQADEAGKERLCL